MNKTSLLYYLVAILFFSCSDDRASENKQNESVIAVEPYKLINTKKENVNGSYNEMILYCYADNPSNDTLYAFCAKEKKTFTDGIFHIIVFFDSQVNAQFPNNPITALYMDEIPSRHIKAIYTYNRLNGYSKLDFYDKNSWESVAISKEIN